MATLVLSTVGTALAGPLGGALGSVVGQSIDQSLFGPGIRKGPRLGDLSVQTSSYGSPIPRIYGTMRVAGTVIWSTDIQEDESVEGGGKGSPEYVAYRYSASFAVALSSRPIREVRRIWADGKLIRGAAGDFKVKATFRLCPGSEDQAADPMIASIEGISQTSAYRGLALAIFEDLDLGEFGNRIPVLTFEVVADDGVNLSELLGDASGGSIVAEDARQVSGYAAHGASIGDSLGNLINLFGVRLADRDGALRTPGALPPASIGENELGCGIEGHPAGRVERSRAPNSAMPASLAMTYYDPDRDYQTGQMRASSGSGRTRSEKVELPAVMSGDQAKALVEEALARKWRSGDRLRISLSPTRISMRPGDSFQLAGQSGLWVAESVTIDGLKVAIEAVMAPPSLASLPADPGRATSSPDEQIGRTELALIEAPATGDQPSAFPLVHLAASSGGGWKAVPVELRLGTEALPSVALLRRAKLGHATSVLAPRSPMIMDARSTVTVRMVDDQAALFHADDDAMMAGANLAMLGEELIQFGQADELEPGLYRLSRLLRGRRGTEWAAAGHQMGETFCLVDQAARPVELPPTAVGSTLAAIAHGIADAAPLPEVARAISGEAMRPPSPCHLQAWVSGGSISAQWVRRSHRGWAWLDEVGVPDDSFAEAYRVTLEGPAGSIVRETQQPSIAVAATELPGTAGEEIKLSVVTIGPKAVSRDISTTLIL